MAYPQIDLPMYRAAGERSAELFLPNINLIAPNSITLLETNQKFIEVVHGRAQPRVRARAAVARVSRPTSAAATSASSGTCAASGQRGPERTTRCKEQLRRHSAAAPWLPDVEARRARPPRGRASANEAAGSCSSIRGELLKKISDRGDLRAARGVAARRTPDERTRSIWTPAQRDLGRHSVARRGGQPAARARCARRSTRPRSIRTSTSSAST